MSNQQKNGNLWAAYFMLDEKEVSLYATNTSLYEKLSVTPIEQINVAATLPKMLCYLF
jgi:hypothetical protein